MTTASRQRAIVTGATGFLGRHLTARLLREAYEVHALVRPRSNLAGLGDLPGVNVHVIDETGDNLDEIVARAEPDITFHLATHFIAEHAAHDVAPLIAANILFPCRLVDAMVRHSNRRLVNCSSAWQHYNSEEYDPVNLYAATKQAFLALLKYYVAAGALAVTDLTISDTYGPSDPRPKLFSLLYRSASSGVRLAFSPGEQLLDIVYVDDVIDAMMIAANRIRENERAALDHYAISAQHPITLKNLVSTFASITGLSPNIAWGARPYRKREMMVPWRGGKSLPGWKPVVTIEDGIRHVHASHVRNTKN